MSMSAAKLENGSKKRTCPSGAFQAGEKRLKHHNSRRTRLCPQRTALGSLHEAIVGELQAKHNVLVASIISSTSIRKRVDAAVAHLDASTDESSCVVLLYARTAQVCKMITVAECCKRLLVAKKSPWYQYNQMFDVPASFNDRSDSLEETGADNKEQDYESDAFETMESRLEKAILPSRPEKVIKSLRIFLSSKPIPKLRIKNGVTFQSSENSTLD